MKILAEHLIQEATISALNANPLYPAENIAGSSMRKKYQANGPSDTITIAYSEDKTTNCFFWGYTNMTNMLVEFLDSGGNVVELVYFEDGNVGHFYGYPNDNAYGFGEGKFYGYYDRKSDHFYDPVSWFFPSAITFRSIRITIEGPDPVYLGAVGIGMALTMPNPRNGWNEGWDDASIVSQADAGQVQSQYCEPIRVYDFTFNVDRATMNLWRDWYKQYGLGWQIWFDTTEKNHDFIIPMYGFISAWGADTKTDDRYEWKIELKEAR